MNDITACSKCLYTATKHTTLGTGFPGGCSHDESFWDTELVRHDTALLCKGAALLFCPLTSYLCESRSQTVKWDGNNQVKLRGFAFI